MRPVSSGRIRARLHIALLLVGATLAAPAVAQDARQLHDVEAALAASQQKAAALTAAAAALASETAALQAQLVQAGANTQAAETELTGLEDDLARLTGERKVKAAALAAERRNLAASMAALERLSATPPGAVIVADSPLDLARGSLLLSVAAPELQRRAQRLAADIAALDGLQRDIAQRQDRARIVLASLQADRSRIADLLARKAELQRRTAADAAVANARSAKLAADAKDLQALMDRLAEQRRQEDAARQKALEAEQQRQLELQKQQQAAAAAAAVNNAVKDKGRPPTHAQPQAQSQPQQQLAALPPAAGRPRPFPAMPGGLAVPVSGRIVQRFGIPNEAGSTSKGILLQTRPQAAVLAPFDGQVVFEGPFRSYGEILIIQHADGYHSLLAGLAHSNAAVGQWVVTGEPVGAMGPSKDGNPKLYMELRRDGRPIDPAPWLGKTDSKME